MVVWPVSLAVQFSKPKRWSGRVMKIQGSTISSQLGSYSGPRLDSRDPWLRNQHILRRDFRRTQPPCLVQTGRKHCGRIRSWSFDFPVDAWESGRRLFYILVAVEKRLGIKPVKVWRWSHDQLRSSWQFHDAELIGAGNCTGVSQYGISVGIWSQLTRPIIIHFYYEQDTLTTIKFTKVHRVVNNKYSLYAPTFSRQELQDLSAAFLACGKHCALPTSFACVYRRPKQDQPINKERGRFRQRRTRFDRVHLPRPMD